MKILYKELASDILFLSQKSALDYNGKRSIELTLKEGDKVYLLRKNIITKRLSETLDYRKLGLFKIIRKISIINFELQLPKTINIYPVFYISLLEKALLGALVAPIIEI